MSVALLTEHHLEPLSLKGGCTGSCHGVYTCQNATLLEITYSGSIVLDKWHYIFVQGQSDVVSYIYIGKQNGRMFTCRTTSLETDSFKTQRICAVSEIY